MPSFSNGAGAMSIQNAARAVPSVLQTGNVAVTDECRPQFALAVRFPVLDFEIENADTIARFSLINPAIARTDHHAVAGLLLASDINHRVSDRRIALDRVSAGPEKKIARF